MLLLPPPEGAATTNRQPEAPGLRVVIVILGLLARAALEVTSARRPHSLGPRWPLRGSARLTPRSRPSFEILHLLAHLLDQHLELERNLRQLGVDRLRAERVRFAMQLLREEVEALADVAALRQDAPDLGNVRRKPRHLLGDVDAGGEQRELLLQPLVVGLEPRLAQPA